VTGIDGAVCQPKSRDCTSALDNNCNGTPDNQETTYCVCPVGQSRHCQEHPGYDGVGICKFGRQSCLATTDKTASSWDTCTDAVAPNPTEVCDAAGLDENCNGQSNEGCECVNGTSVPCECGPATTCTNGKKGTCSVTKTTLYRDFDGDGYGNPAQPAMVCPGTSGYASNADDCDDNNGAFKPGVSICGLITQARTCNTGGGGTPVAADCPQGCINGSCRNDGTIGLPGYVSCVNSSRCLAADGCMMDDPAGGCGTTGDAMPYIHCDGPNDCPGQVCVILYSRLLNEAKCYATKPPDDGGNTYNLICDPMASTCTPPLLCTKVGRYPLYQCE
jgi:hypothetical protein